MTRTTTTCVCVLLLAGLAGCLGEPDPSPAAPDPEEDAIPGAGSGTAPPGELKMTNCRWLTTIHDFPYGTNPAPVPSWWEAEDPAPLTSNVLEMYQCGSFGLDHFDRPLTLLLESSTNGVPPEDCFIDREGRALVHVLNLYVDDQEVARWLSIHYEAPAKVASFDVASDATETTWTWVADDEPSSLTYAPNESGEPIPPRNLRVLWATHDGTLRLDLDFERVGPIITTRAATGTLAQAHNATAYPGGTFAGFAAASDQARVRGQMTWLGPSCAPLA